MTANGLRTPKYSIPTSECLHSLILEGQCLVLVSVPHWLRSLGSGRGVPIHQSSEPCIKGEAEVRDRFERITCLAHWELIGSTKEE